MILFDVDGTLLLIYPVGRDAMSKAMEEVWGIPDALQGVHLGGFTDGAAAECVATGRDPGEMWARYLVHLRAMTAARGDIAPLPGVLALLDALEARGHRPGLLTGNIRAGAEIKLAAAGLQDRFDYQRSAFAEDGEDRLAIAETARRRCGDGPLTVVGDTLADIRCARHIGARVLTVATGHESEERLQEAGPDRCVPDLSATDDLCEWLLARSP